MQGRHPLPIESCQFNHEQGLHAGPFTSQLGGPVNYAFFSLWLALGFSGWMIACACLSALQRYENHSGISDGQFSAL